MKKKAQDKQNVRVVVYYTSGEWRELRKAKARAESNSEFVRRVTINK